MYTYIATCGAKAATKKKKKKTMYGIQYYMKKVFVLNGTDKILLHHI